MNSAVAQPDAQLAAPEASHRVLDTLSALQGFLPPAMAAHTASTRCHA